MNTSQTDEQILEEYKNKADEILKRMYSIIVRAQRKLDDKTYKKILTKLQTH